MCNYPIKIDYTVDGEPIYYVDYPIRHSIEYHLDNDNKYSDDLYNKIKELCKDKNIKVVFYESKRI